MMELEERAASGPAPGLQVYEFGAWQINLAKRELRSRGRPVPIGSRAFEIIEVLVQAAGELVAKDDLMARLWPGAIVGDNTLQVHVSAVRKALGSDRAMLKTASGRGYRLLGDWQVRKEAPAHPVAAVPARLQARLPKTNLPAASANLVGREVVIQHLQALLSAYRVVTLKGPGGIGKSALALEFARRLFPSFRGDVWLIELASLSAPDLVASTLASTIGLQLGGAAISPEAVGRAIGKRKMLLILDNCEHVIEAAARLMETLVHLCPEVAALATSREVLRIDGEYVYRVPPLDVPQQREDVSDRVLDFSAVQLFVARATALHARLSPRAEELQAIAAICRHLDGIPLAIEFAAARAATLGPLQVATRLDDRFRLLTVGRRTALPRHRTLRATLDWSYELLPEGERSLLRQLGIFAGGFTLEAAAAVAADEDDAAAPLVHRIANLVDKSLVTFEASLPDRWRLLETIRAYALQKLAEYGEVQRAGRRHAEYFRDLFASSALEANHQRSREDLAPHIREIDNVRAALDWSFAPSGDVTIGVDLTAAYAQTWLHLSLVVECRERCEHALLHCPSNSGTHSWQELRLLVGLGSSLILTMGPADRALAMLTKALALAERLGDLDTQARILWGLNTVLERRGEWTMSQVAGERLAKLAHQIGDPAIVAVADRLIGLALLRNVGKPREAQRCFERALQFVGPATDQRRTVWSQSENRASARALLSLALCLQGFAEKAQSEARASVSELPSDVPQLSFCRVLIYGLCRVALLTGDLAAADWAMARLKAAAISSPFWQIEGRFLEAKLMIERRDFASGLVILNEAFGTRRRVGWSAYPEFECALAEALAGLGQFKEALDVVDRALAVARRDDDGQAWYLPELLRIKGQTLVRCAADQSESLSADCFSQACKMAKGQDALLFELRATIDLARLRVKQGRRTEARDILDPVYERFSEGFEIPDLRAARSLLAMT